MPGHRSDKGLAELAELFLTDTADARELCLVRRIIAGHLPQGYVREYDVGRHTPFISQLFPKLPQDLKERLITSDFARAMFRRKH